MSFYRSNPNDQVYYWHQILTFREVGFQGGYYVVNEVPPPISAFHFGAAGPFFPALYGTIARFTGWQPYTGILFNIAILTAALWIFLKVTRFNHQQILLTGLVVLGITPILIFLPMLLQEAIHQGAALILAGVFYRLFFHQDSPSLRFRLLVSGFIIALSFIRFSWVFVLLPFLFLSGEKGSRRSLLSSALITALVMVGVLVIFQRISAPGNNSIFGRLGGLSASPVDGLRGLLGIVHFNIRAAYLRDGDEFIPDTALLFNFEYLVFTVVAYLGCFGLIRRRLRPPSGTRWTGRWEIAFHLYNLGALLLGALIFYLPSGYPRVFAPYLLISLLLLVAFKRYRLVAAFLVVSLFSIGFFLNDFRRDHAILFQQGENMAQVETMRAAFAPHIVYDPGTNNTWCNTLLLPARFLDHHVMTVPAGIGVSFFRNEGPAYPLKSHYLLIGDEEYEVMEDQLRVEELATVFDATLYRNLDSGCG